MRYILGVPQQTQSGVSIVNGDTNGLTDLNPDQRFGKYIPDRFSAGSRRSWEQIVVSQVLLGALKVVTGRLLDARLHGGRRDHVRQGRAVLHHLQAAATVPGTRG